MLSRFLPFGIFLVIAGLLFVGLHHNPREIPSPLLGKRLPAVSLPTLAEPGIKVDSELFKGKVTVLNVFASWCVACRAEHPIMMDLANQKIPGVQLIGLDYKDPEVGAVKKWFASDGNPYQKVLLDQLGNFAINMGVYGTPETFIVDRQAVIRYKYIGPISPDVLKSTIMPEIHNVLRV